MRTLNTNVFVDGTWYGPGDRMPTEVAEKIANPKVWDGEAPEVQEPVVDEVKQPPRKGPGSGGPAWVEFAKSKGVTEQFSSKDELIGALEDRGLIEKE